MLNGRAVGLQRIGPLLLALLASCASAPRAEVDWSERDIGTFEYHPVLYHLDLCTLSYQLYAQTLVWPFDPYYRVLSNLDFDRDLYMRKVRSWAHERGEVQVSESPGLSGYRGPGVLGGFENNPFHDPLLFRYDGIVPSRKSLTNAGGKNWIVLEAPPEITRTIGSVGMCYRTTGEPAGSVTLNWVRRDEESEARDVLLAFEGGTGSKGLEGRPVSQSLMGFVLLRTEPGGDYDVHVVFRGSRSGDPARAAQSAYSDNNAAGNPDWITDMGYGRLTAESGGALISTTGKVNRGFAYSIRSILPQLIRCLEEVANLRDGAPPNNVYVTGHSLGGGLSQHFVSSILLGNRFGPRGTGPDMPAALMAWPWEQIKLITYGSPRAGDKEWARELTARLQVDFFSTAIYPLDEDALAPGDGVIVERLLDVERPTGYRVLMSTDPVTTEKIVGGKHVGKSVYVNEPKYFDYLPRLTFAGHEPLVIREFITASVRDPRTPQEPLWRKPKIAELDSWSGGESQEEEVRKFVQAYERYCLEHGIVLDEAAFDRDIELRFAIDAIDAND